MRALFTGAGSSRKRYHTSENLQYFTYTAGGVFHRPRCLISIVVDQWDAEPRSRINPSEICGKISAVAHCVPVFVFMIAVTMFAGAGALLSDVLGTPTWVGATGMAVVVAITLMFGFRNLVEIIGRIGPVIVIVIGIVALWVVVENFAALADVPENLAQYQPAKASENWFIGTILYSTAILIIAVPFLTSLGREDRSLPSTVRPSILTGFLYGGVMGLCALALLATLPMVYTKPPPGHAWHRHRPVAHTFSIITLWAFTHRSPMLWTVADQFPPVAPMPLSA